jgi:hypothetical protein
MRLPNGDHARVDQKKITEYLLNESHPDGWGKAKFFRAHGFNQETWQVLADALARHGRQNPVTGSMESPFGTRYSVVGPLEAPSGRRPMLVTVWIVEKGSDAPRLVTAYPQPGRR